MENLTNEQLYQRSNTFHFIGWVIPDKVWGIAMIAGFIYIIYITENFTSGLIFACLFCGVLFGIKVFAMVKFNDIKVEIDSRREGTRHGTARLATNNELDQGLDRKDGFYIGGGYYFPEMTHGLLTAASGSGKGTTILVPNLLKSGKFKGSFVVIDPKGENAAITARIQREQLGRKVVILNPWELHSLTSDAYNPLDLLVYDRKNLSDDVEMIAETIIPTSTGNQAHWDDKARAILTAFILHLVTTAPEDQRHLGTIFSWLGHAEEDWNMLLATMSVNDDAFVGDIISGEANRILSLMKSEKEYSGVLSTLNRHMDFIKSPALRDALKKSKGFVPSDLTKQETILYIIIPADKLTSHAKWLRLVTTTLMKSVVRDNTIKKENEVCFILDEFYSLGYLPIIEMALAQFRGFGVHVWTILQDLSQLKTNYKSWETFIANCNLKQFLNIQDEFTADYVSKMLGKASVISYDKDYNVSGSSSRMLFNADEVRNSKWIISFIGNLRPTQLEPIPYYDKKFKLVLGKDYDPNPYVRYVTPQ